MASRKSSTRIDMHSYAKERNVYEDVPEAPTSGMEGSIVSSLRTHGFVTRYPTANLSFRRSRQEYEASFQREQSQDMLAVVGGRSADAVTYDIPSTSSSADEEHRTHQMNYSKSRLGDNSLPTAGNRRIWRVSSNEAPRKLTSQEDVKKYSCSRCGRGPMKRCHLYAHYRNVHHIKKEELEAIKKEIGRASKVDRRSFACSVCGGQFYSRSGLWLHNKKVHQLAVKGTITCPACSKKLHTVEELAVHCNSEHDRGNSAHGTFAVRSGTFASRTEFETWLNDVENITCTNFSTRTSRCTPHGKIVYLRCRFSGGTGAVVDPKVLKRAYRTSVKVHRDCPAFLKVFEDTQGFVHYKYCAGHLGHKITTEALRTPANDVQHRRLLKLPTELIHHRQFVRDDVPEECETMSPASPSTFENCSSGDPLSRVEDEFNQLDAVVAQMVEEMKRKKWKKSPKEVPKFTRQKSQLADQWYKVSNQKGRIQHENELTSSHSYIHSMLLERRVFSDYLLICNTPVSIEISCTVAYSTAVF
ncbi:unnamed protein product [Cylicocyclus nassatus]|uniref:C2H2-type domain-containing protein n=1 Tax=Cylicocyclus nassatus TaxID=53992 RepID=A0AA36LZ98_CYLNA|nr:unnamed protein product [Cylicocyclus nassatus]